MFYFRLCKAGYASSILEAKAFDARTVIQALHYESFLSDYQEAAMEVNKS